MNIDRYQYEASKTFLDFTIAIIRNYLLIEAILTVFGFAEGKWEKLQKLKSYEAFIVLRKKI